MVVSVSFKNICHFPEYKLNFFTVPWLGLVAVGISVDIYAIFGEAVYGRGTDSWGTDCRSNDDREKDVVPS